MGLLLRILILCVVFPALCFAQASTGIKIGGGYYKLNGVRSNYDLGYEAGFFSKAELGKKASLLVELDYSVKKTEVIVHDTSHSLEQNFVNFRFSVGYDFTEHFFASAGPSFSYMITPAQTPKIIPASYYTHFAVGIDPCIGFETIHFIFLLRYEAALTVLTLESTPEAKGNVLTGARFNGLKLAAGVKF